MTQVAISALSDGVLELGSIEFRVIAAAASSVSAMLALELVCDRGRVSEVDGRYSADVRTNRRPIDRKRKACIVVLTNIRV